MCFSAEASFGSGIILSVAGVAALRNASEPRRSFFAAIPLLFAAQQITEGLLWLSLENSIDENLQHVFTWCFIFFAQVLWPFWVPYSILKWNEEKLVRGRLVLLTIIGALVSAYLAFCLLYFPVTSKVEGAHIRYIQLYPQVPGYFSGVLYVVATVAPLLLMRDVWMIVLGCLVFASYIITAIFYAEFVVSVWCYFAAVLSGIIYFIVRNRKKADPIRI